MKKVVVLLVLAIAAVGCKQMAKEIKKTQKIKKAAKEVCDCKTVSVESEYRGSTSVTISLDRSDAEDREANADDIIINVKKAFPNLCNYDEVFVIYEGEDFDERFTYYSCDMNAERDTLEASVFNDDDFDFFDEFDESEEGLNDKRIKEAEAGN